ncbi:MAG TPA: DNA topoisomerase [Thiopseudomonas sp.]|nr:DNA topoisomerase [Pseudomonas sp.]HKM38607.1 DNA topoisomerase [Thiopseudomonas sp.]
MSNSAHDDISLIAGANLEGISDPDQRKIYQLIDDMQQSTELGAAHLIRQDIELELVRPEGQDDFTVHLQTQMALEPGWLQGPLGAYFSGEQSQCVSKTDIEALKKGDFTIEVSLPDAPPAFSLTELIQQMDIFEVGRPSTVAHIIEQLMQDSSLIHISKELDQVTMTPAGQAVYQVLQEQLHTKDGKNIATRDWNTELMALLSLVESGSLSPDIPLMVLFEDLYGQQARTEVQHLSWLDPDVLYQPVTSDAVGGGKIAISRTQVK